MILLGTALALEPLPGQQKPCKSCVSFDAISSRKMHRDLCEHPKSCKTLVNETDLNFAHNHKDQVTFKRKQKDANHAFLGL